MRHDRAFLGEAIDMFRLAGDIAHGDEQREIGILHIFLLDEGIEVLLHIFPHRKAIRLDNHAAAHGRVFGHVGSLDDLLIPFGEVFFARGGNRGFGIFLFLRCFSHDVRPFAVNVKPSDYKHRRGVLEARRLNRYFLVFQALYPYRGRAGRPPPRLPSARH